MIMIPLVRQASPADYFSFACIGHELGPGAVASAHLRPAAAQLASQGKFFYHRPVVTETLFAS
jgi:hypothetical protein